MEVIEAELENGVLRPMRRLSLRPGERVGIVVELELATDEALGRVEPQR